MKTYEVTLTLIIEEGDPRKWGWHEMLDLHDGEQVWVSSKEIEGKCDVCEAKDGEPHCDCGNCDCGDN